MQTQTGRWCSASFIGVFIGSRTVNSACSDLDRYVCLCTRSFFRMDSEFHMYEKKLSLCFYTVQKSNDGKRQSRVAKKGTRHKLLASGGKADTQRKGMGAAIGHDVSLETVPAVCVSHLERLHVTVCCTTARQIPHRTSKWLHWWGGPIQEGDASCYRESWLPTKTKCRYGAFINPKNILQNTNKHI